MTYISVERQVVLKACQEFPSSYGDYVEKNNPYYQDLPDDHIVSFERKLDRIRTLNSMCGFCMRYRIDVINLSLEDYEILEGYFA